MEQGFELGDVVSFVVDVLDDGGLGGGTGAGWWGGESVMQSVGCREIGRGELGRDVLDLGEGDVILQGLY